MLTQLLSSKIRRWPSPSSLHPESEEDASIKRFAYFQFLFSLPRYTACNNIARRFSASHLPSVSASTIRLSFSTFLFANLASLSPSPFTIIVTGEKTHLKTEIASKSGNKNERLEERLLFNEGTIRSKSSETFVLPLSLLGITHSPFNG